MRDSDLSLASATSTLLSTIAEQAASADRRSRRPLSTWSRIIFLEPNPSMMSHGNSMNDALNIDVVPRHDGSCTRVVDSNGRNRTVRVKFKGPHSTVRGGIRAVHRRHTRHRMTARGRVAPANPELNLTSVCCLQAPWVRPKNSTAKNSNASQGFGDAGRASQYERPRPKSAPRYTSLMPHDV